MKKLLLASALFLIPSVGWAACSSPISSLNATGATVTLGATVDASNNCWGGTAIVDGTAAANKAAVKAASTAAAATDPALVVAISPNNTIAATQSGAWAVSASGNFGVTQVTSPWVVSQSGTWTVQPGNTANTTPWLVTQSLGTTNGWTPKLLNALSTTVIAIKGSAGELGMLQCYNPNSSQVYIQTFNITSGSVTLGTSTPTLSIPIGPTATGGWALANPGVNFSTAISIAATTTATGSTAPSTAVDCNAVYN